MHKTGILGGTFDPPHMAHIMMAKAAVIEAGLDRVLLMPNGDPPYKKPSVTAKDRLKMAKLAALDAEKEIAGIIDDKSGLKCRGHIEVCGLEIMSKGFSFLADSLERIKADLKDEELYFLAGSDALSGMASWRGSDRIFKTASIIAFERKGLPGLSIGPVARYLSGKGANVIILPAELPDISSTVIRKMIAEGKDCSGLISPAVLAYIRENKLYS